MPFAADIVRAFASASVQRGMPPEALNEVGAAMLGLRSRYSREMEPLLGCLQADEQRGVLELMARASGA